MRRQQLLETLAERIAGLSARHPTRVAIDGIDAAGKTTLAEQLVGPIEQRGRPVIRASLDGFHKPRAIRYRRGNESAEGYYQDSFDYPLLVSCLLAPLGPGGSGRYQAAGFDHRTDSRLAPPMQRASANAVLLLDGVFLLRPELRDYWEFTLFLKVSFEVAVARAIERDTILREARRAAPYAEALRARYLVRYVPGQRLYLEQCQPERLADVVVDNNDPENPVIIRSG